MAAISASMLIIQIEALENRSQMNPDPPAPITLPTDLQNNTAASSDIPTPTESAKSSRVGPIIVSVVP